MHAYCRRVSREVIVDFLGTALPEQGQNFHTGEMAACPLTGIAVVEEPVGKEFQQDQSYSESVPMTGGPENCRWGNLASG